MDNDEAALVLNVAIRLELGLEVALLLPPGVPRRLNGNGVVCLEVGVFKRSNTLLLSGRCVLDVGGDLGLVGLFLFGLLLFIGDCVGGLNSSLCLFRFELRNLFGLLAVLFYYNDINNRSLIGLEKLSPYTLSRSWLWEHQRLRAHLPLGSAPG